MPPGDASHRSPEEPGALADTDSAAGHSDGVGKSRLTDGPPGSWAGRPGRSQAEQQEILAQFEAAIAGMHTREIQIGLRQLLGGLDSSAAAGRRETAEAARNHVAAGADGIADPPLTGAEEVAEARSVGTAGDEGGREAGALTGRRPGLDLDQVPRLVAELVRAVRTPSARRQLERLVGQAELQRPVTIDLDTAARMVRPYTWLLGRVGHEGIRLTDAGHLPPDEVSAVIGTLGLRAARAARAGSSVKRENQAPAVVQLRESAQATGLVRKERGRLLRTAIGDELQSDPAGLWWHLAARMPLCSAAVSEGQPGLILLTCVAARFTETVDLTIARMLTAIGWVNRDGSPLTGHEATRATSGTHAVLRRLGVLPDHRRAGPGPGPTPEGVAFARAALRTWPEPG